MKYDWSDLKTLYIDQALSSEDIAKLKRCSGVRVREVVESFGRPYDIILGAMEQNRIALYEEVERELGPKLADAAANQAVRAAFQEQQKLLRNLIIGILTVIGAPVIACSVTWILRQVGILVK